MKLINGYLILLILLLLLLGFIILSPTLGGATGTVHPSYQSMQKSGSSVATSPPLKWAAYLFGLGILGLFAFPLFLGARKTSKTKTSKIIVRLLPGVLLYLGIYTAMVITYWLYTSGKASRIYWGFPLPTTIMLFGLGLTPLFFALHYILKFDEWIINPEEIEQFQEIVKKRQAQKRMTP